jgi:hypothetical protein
VTVRIITSFRLPGARLRAAAMRRKFIYPHRSVRSWRPAPSRLLLALATATVLITSVALNQDEIFRVHNQICLGLLSLSGIPTSGTEMVEIFPGLSPAPVPAAAVVRLDQRPLLLAAAFGAALLLLLLLHRFFPLARGFVLFLLVLLVLAATVVLFFPAKQFGAAQFAQIWLRGEVLVWMLLPVFSVAMVTVLHPVGILGIGWAVLIQLFGFLWSAVRLAFFLGIMHFSGILFVPLLWFAFGLLADMVYLIVFHSLAVHRIASRAWGRGAE